jgi:hypothetical protein
MGEQRLGTLAVRLPAEDATAGRHTHDEWAGELAVRAVSQPSGLGDDLVIGRIHVVGELDLDTGPQSVRCHADRRTDDAQFVDRHIEAAVLAILRLQALRGAEHAAEEAHILAEYDDVVVALHHYVHGVADRLDHGHARHASDSRRLALAAQMRRHLRIHAFEHVARGRAPTRVQRPVALRFTLRLHDGVHDFRLRLAMAFLRPDAAPRQVVAQSDYRITERPGI